MLCVNAPPKKAQEGGGSEVFQELKGICIALGMSKPPANITMFQFFSGIEKKVRYKGRKFWIFMMLLFWWKIVLLPGWDLPLVKLQCLDCEGELRCFTGYTKSQNFENYFEGFFHAKAWGQELLLSSLFRVTALGFDAITCCRRHREC